MPSQTKENYLKAIYFLSKGGERISISALSKQMEVSKATVNSMVKKLQEKKWVVYEKYKPIQLTKEGAKIAALIIRKHRLTEMFLVKIMGFGWEQVHDIAEEMEHLNSEELFDRMDELLGYPTVDPHGSPIPDKSGEVSQKDYSKLSTLKKGTKVRLCALSESSTDFLLYLNSKQIKLGTELTIVSVEPFDNSMVVTYDQYPSMMLSEQVCSRLLVEEVVQGG